MLVRSKYFVTLNLADERSLFQSTGVLTQLIQDLTRSRD